MYGGSLTLEVEHFIKEVYKNIEEESKYGIEPEIRKGSITKTI